MSLFSITNIATLLSIIYLSSCLHGLLRLMHPLRDIDVTSYPPDKLIKPYWVPHNNEPVLEIKVYLSTSPDFTVDALVDEYRMKQNLQRKRLEEMGQEIDEETRETLPVNQHPKEESILVWEEEIVSSSPASLSKSLILTSLSEIDTDAEPYMDQDASFQFAKTWLNNVQTKANKSVVNSVASQSVWWNLYTCIKRFFFKDETIGQPLLQDQTKKVDYESVYIPKSSKVWTRLRSNSTMYVHAILARDRDRKLRQSGSKHKDTFHTALQTLQSSWQRHDILHGNVELIKFMSPKHVPKPKRKLYNDILYIIQRILRLSDANKCPPWDMSLTQSKEYQAYQGTLDMQERKEGYPYWKPQVSIKLVADYDSYPISYMKHSGMGLIRVEDDERGAYESGMAYLPGLYVDEIGVTSDMYVPVNRTVTALPLRISFDKGLSLIEKEGDDDSSETTMWNVNANDNTSGLSPARWRLLSSLSQTMEHTSQFGFEASDIDDVRRLIADTNITFLVITLVASTLHLLFEFLTFKTEVEFWKRNNTLTGLSVRSLFFDCVGQIIIWFYLIEMDSSLLVTGPCGIGVLISLWKCQKAAGFRFVRYRRNDGTENDGNVPIWNEFLRAVFQCELVATRLRAASDSKLKTKNNADNPTDLAAITEHVDRLATRTLGYYFLLPLVSCYALHTLLNHTHTSWYSYLISTSSSAVYGLGFVLMTPQLFLNYRLRSVAHLPWKVLGYRFVNTFIDDLFSFLIRMPMMARIGCFRDDVVFFIYLYQRWLYPVDSNRPSDGGGMDSLSSVEGTATIAEKKGTKETKKTQ